jgi:hypothetical protein
MPSMPTPTVTDPGRFDDPAPLDRPATTAGGADLATLLARRTPVAWFEAVAVVQELCARLLASGPSGRPSVPELRDIVITQDGTIDVLREGSGREPAVARAARFLLALAGDSQALPVPLRLIALQEVSPSPSCGTLAELSTRLAAFERPGRQSTIRGVYERFRALPALEGPQASASPAAGPRAGSAAKVRRWRRISAAATAASVLLAAVAAGAWLWPRMASPPEGLSGSRVGQMVRDAGSAVAAAGQTATVKVRRFARRMGVNVPDRPAAQRTAVPAPVAVPEAAPVRRARARPTAPAAPPPATAAPVASAPVPPDATIYTAADRDVTPPKALRSRLPAEPEAGVRAEDLPEVEIVVSPGGDVESVRLVTPHAGVRSAMMLSAIKSWRFDPAIRNAQPVRYRLLLRLTNQ